MTTHSITCEQFADRLADLLERAVSEDERTALESHAARCAECGPLVADLRKLRTDAANLPELTPSRDLWAGIEARIATPVIALTPGAAGVPSVRRPRRMPRWAWPAAAAALVVFTAGTTYVITRRVMQPAVEPSRVAEIPLADTIKPVTVSATVAAPAAPVALASNKAPEAQNAADAVYDREITRLRAIVRLRRDQVDSTTLQVIERNLKVIDDAIAQCKDALRRDPASRFLMESLNNALDNKVELLRTAAMLPARTS